MNEKEFSISWIEKISHRLLRSFPDDFINTKEVENINLPKVDLLLGAELFGNYDIVDTKGNSILIVDDYFKAKYIIYSNRLKPQSIEIPRSEQEIMNLVKAYEVHLDSLLKQIESDYNAKFPKSKNHLQLINEMFSCLNIKRL